MSQILLLPAPLSSTSFTLGQLLSEPLHPGSTFFKPATKPACNQPTTQSRYEDVLSQDDQGRFLSSLGKTASSLDNTVVLNADEMSLLSLANPPAAFELLRRDTEAQSFLRKSALQRQPLYFVTGIQKLRNASYQKRSSERAGSTAEATGHQLRLPIHVRRDSAELESEQEDTRESVFAVELMKVACRAGAKEEPHTLEDIDYVWTYHALEEPGMQLSIGLGKALQPKELRALVGITVEEDLEEQRHYDHYFEDEGLAGF
ncbi:uncharacterized protein EKO05_0006801 [Ascochyta rabiei]|uniref:Uncharacterized protein n=1 Tax=Didymella rabiei TaxID=5454 RepID=A0A162VA42_DIDRA|nr:uncharacterized protein EKO05_0006801 [Ascochyta rabiei]KZM18320.1 hypothetical protein ST47_g10535 [Ascochyta rabiei]UPX16396.1 hypothetical protein EKO05_0006801 [Ascochyta rabiei]